MGSCWSILMAGVMHSTTGANQIQRTFTQPCGAVNVGSLSSLLKVSAWVRMHVTSLDFQARGSLFYTTRHFVPTDRLSKIVLKFTGFLLGFCPRKGEGRGQNERLYELLGGQVCIPVQSTQQTESGGMLAWEILILGLLLDAIWWNLGLFSHKPNLPFIVSLKLL